MITVISLWHTGEMSVDLNRVYEQARVAKEEMVLPSPVKVCHSVSFGGLVVGLN